MQSRSDKLVVLITKGIESELSSVAFTIANGGITAGLQVSVFLTSTGIDLVRKGGQRMTHVPPLDPLSSLIENFRQRGGTIWACPPCVTSRGYTQEDMLDGVVIVGASAMHAEIKEGAATLSF
ncbi:DsrE family protein [Rhizobium sp. L43]|uniref:DsrE family protein n=1 Tax=Rhizobium sp. L43 TaxID=2035452 RepID=UPI000BE9101B|nr:DsrE family protein [Rhizobium sp. L43]PDS77869.1 peroxiredoxin [Rhizobium sp. L43]